MRLNQELYDNIDEDLCSNCASFLCVQSVFVFKGKS